MLHALKFYFLFEGNLRGPPVCFFSPLAGDSRSVPSTHSGRLTIAPGPRLPRMCTYPLNTDTL